MSSQFRYFAETGSRSRPVPQYTDMPFRAVRSENKVPRLVACVDDGEQANAISEHALAIACSLGLEVTFARVIEAPGHFSSPADPIEWQLRRRAQHENLSKFADQDEVEVRANSVLLAGAPAEEISDWAQGHGATLLAIGRRRSDTTRGLGSTAQALLDRADHSLLLVPPGPPRKGGYRRIMVPIDGSTRADSVLPIARRIARTHAADLMLVHIVPRLEVVGHPVYLIWSNCGPKSTCITNATLSSIWTNYAAAASKTGWTSGPLPAGRAIRDQCCANWQSRKKQT